MEPNRLEAFSDGVLAIVITIMVLEFKAPHEPTWQAVSALWPVFLAYVLSFIYIGIYWNNHHHMIRTTKRVTGGILWANLHLLFWLSLIPFLTAWTGETGFASFPTLLYGVGLLGAALAYFILQGAIIRSQGPDSHLKRALGTDIKGKVSPLLYIAGIAASHFNATAGLVLYAVVAAIWLVPDRRIERTLTGSS